MRTVSRRSSLSKDTLGRLCFSSRHYGAGDVDSVKDCIVVEEAIVVVIVRGESHAVLRCVPWVCVFDTRRNRARGTRVT